MSPPADSKAFPSEQGWYRTIRDRIELERRTDQLLTRTREWSLQGDCVWTCNDGRLAIVVAPDILIIPAPAADIWREAQARKTVRMLNDAELLRR
jgi:hypothetical protein